MAIGRLFKFIVLLVLVLVTGLVVYLSTANLKWLQPHLTGAIERHTGRALTIGGEFQLKLLPTPTFLVEGVVLANSDWGSEPAMLQIERVAGRVGFYSLLSGPVVVETLSLEGVSVLLETDVDGRSNWTMTAEPGGAEPLTLTELSIPVIFDDTAVEHVTAVYRSPGLDDREAGIDRLQMDLPEPGMQSIRLEGVALGQTLSLEGFYGPVEALGSGDPMAAELEGSLGDVHIEVSGAIGTGSELNVHLNTANIEPVLSQIGADVAVTGALDLKSVIVRDSVGTMIDIEASVGGFSGRSEIVLTDAIVDFTATLDDLAAVGDAFGLGPTPEGDLQLSGQVELGGDQLLLHSVSAMLGENRAEARGQIAGTETALDLHVEAALASVDPSLPDIDLLLTTELKLMEERLALDPLILEFNDSKLAGSLMLMSGDVPSMTGRFQSDRLDLSPFLNAQRSVPEAKDVEDTAEHQTPKDDDGSERYVFVDKPLPLDLLHEANAEIEVDIAELLYGELRIQDVGANVDLHDSTLAAELRVDGLHGGKMRNRVELNASSDMASLTASMLVRDLRLNLASGADAQPESIPPIGVTIEVQSLGSTPRALASNSNGRVLITQGSGVIENKLVGRFSSDLFAQLFSALNPFAGQEEFSKWECTVIGLQIEDGEGEVTGLLAQGQKIKVLGAGQIDLNDETINLEFNTQPRKGIGISADMFVTPFVTLAGTLKSPSIGLNEKGIIIQGGAALMTGGLSLLAKAAFDRAGGSVDRCAAFLEEVGEHQPLQD